MNNFLNLNRHFIDYQDGMNPEELAKNSYLMQFLGKDTNTYWDELTKSKVVIILGEAGSGKTWEFKEQVKKQKENQKFCFFIRLDQLVNNKLTNAINSKDETLFSDWLNSEEEGYFYLDSVDEAKLIKINAFDDALHTFTKGIGNNNLTRSNIIISSRVSEWRRDTDKNKIKEIFNIKELINTKSDTHSNSILRLRIVILAPLEEKQIRHMANSNGISNTDDFIAAINSNDAWEFVSRPLDAVNVINYWNKEGQLGNRQELIEYSISLKLEERGERSDKDPLTLEKSKKGAATIAAAVILCKEFNIQIPDSESSSQKLTLSMSLILPEWTPGELKALRNRAIFDGATYGHIRFHHRTITEYLCACWFEQRIKNQLPYNVLEEILFEHAHGRWIVRPTMSAVAVWLATLSNNVWNKQIRKFILNHQPELFLQFGEPYNLSKNDLVQLLISLKKLYEGRNFVHLSTENYQLSAIAQPKIANEINSSILDKNLAQDIRVKLIIAVWKARLSESALTLIEIINSSDEDKIKQYAAIALKDVASQSQLKKLYSVVNKFTEISPLLCVYLCDTLYPAVVDPIQLFSLLKKITPTSIGLTTESPYYLNRIFKDSDIPSLHFKSLLTEFLSILSLPPHITINGNKTNVSKDLSWLGEALLELIISILSNTNIENTLYPLIANAFNIGEILNEYTHHSNSTDKLKIQLNKKLCRHKELKRFCILNCINKLPKNKRTDMYHVFTYYSLINTQSSDIEWIVKDILNPESNDSQKIAFELALYCHTYCQNQLYIRKQIRKAISGNKALQTSFRKRLPNKIVIFFRRYKFLLSNKHKWRYWRIKVKRVILKTYYRHYNKYWAILHIKNIRNGTEIGFLYNLAKKATELSADSDYIIYDWRYLIKSYNQYIAKAVRDGWISNWKKYTPPIPYPQRLTNMNIIVGLAGIYNTISEDSKTISTFAKDDVALMTRYAVHGLNGYPNWLLDLIKYHPISVQNVLVEGIEKDWQHDASDKHYQGTINHLSYTNKILREIVIDPIIKQLTVTDPLHTSILNDSIKIVLTNTNTKNNEIAAIAKKRINLYNSNDPKYSIWLTTLFYTEADYAISLIEVLINNKQKNIVGIILNISSRLDRRSIFNSFNIESPSYLQAQVLRRLIPIVYHYIQPNNDRDHSNGETYTPNQRDGAESFRNDLLQNLLNSEDPNAYTYLEELLTEPALTSQNDYIQHLLDLRLIIDATLPAWKQEQIAEFERSHESKPRSDHELYKCIKHRFINIKDFIERDDSSPRKIFHKNDDESQLRKWLTDQLNQRANGYYNTAPEVEVDLNKNPDIRIYAPNINPVSVEVKWADKGRSLNSLRNDLKKQLVEHYLRTPNSNYGFYLVGNHGAKSYWEDTDNSSIQLDFDQIIERLQQDAKEIQDKDSNVSGLSVIGIDFTA